MVHFLKNKNGRSQMLSDCPWKYRTVYEIRKLFPSSLQFDTLVFSKSLFPQDIKDCFFKAIQTIFSLQKWKQKKTHKDRNIFQNNYIIIFNYFTEQQSVFTVDKANIRSPSKGKTFSCFDRSFTQHSYNIRTKAFAFLPP